MFGNLLHWPAVACALRPSKFAARRARSTRPRLDRRFVPLERLEPRAVPTVITIGVTSLANAGGGTLRDAITMADGGAAADSYVINIPAGTINLQSALPDLNHKITINGAGETTTIVQRAPAAGTPNFRIFKVDTGQPVTISKLTIAGGMTYGNKGAGLDNLGTLTMNHCTFIGNTAGIAGGGGLANETGGTVTLNDCTFTLDTAEDGGGFANYGMAELKKCVFSQDSAVETGGVFPTGGDGGGLANRGHAALTDCIFFNGNTAKYGGGLFNDKTATVSHCSFTDNHAVPTAAFVEGGSGGGLENLGGSITLTNNCNFTFNTAKSGGGVSTSGTLNAINATFADNTATNLGGGLSNYGTAELSNATFTRNTAGNCGGGLANLDGTATLGGGGFNGNTAVSKGGGIFNAQSTVNVGGVIFSGNTADVKGGALDNHLTGAVAHVGGCQFTGNTSGYDGGGISNDPGANLVVFASYFGHNTAAHDGGGVFNEFLGKVEADFNHFEYNVAGVFGGGLDNEYTGMAIGNGFSHNAAGTDGGGIHDIGGLTQYFDSFFMNTPDDNS
jgi:hypothetical protein